MASARLGSAVPRSTMRFSELSSNRLCDLLHGSPFNAADCESQLAAFPEAPGAHLSAPKSFHELTGQLPQRTPGYAEHAAHYHRFLGAVAAALGGEASSEEVAHASSAAFRAFQVLPADGDGDGEADGGKRPPGLPPRSTASGGATSGGGPPGLGAARSLPPVSKARLKTAHEILGSDELKGAFGGLTIGDEPLRQMLHAHAPLSNWLRLHRQGAPAQHSPSGGGATPAFDASELAKSVDGSGEFARYVAALGESSARAMWELVHNAGTTTAAATYEAGESAQPTGAAAAAAALPSGPVAGGAKTPAEVGSIEWVRELTRTHLLAMRADSPPSAGADASSVSDLEVNMLAATLLQQLHSAQSDDEVRNPGSLPRPLEHLGPVSARSLPGVYPPRLPHQP